MTKIYLTKLKEIYLTKLKEIYNGYNCERIMVAGTAGVHDTRLEQIGSHKWWSLNLI